MPKARSISIRRLAVALAAVVIALPLPPAVLGSSPAPEATSRYRLDQVVVRFRQAPSETDLEIFTGRQFLTLAYYVGLSYPPGLGWYVFQIDDGMDAAIVRDLLRKDPMVCNAELVAIGERHAIGLPDADNAPPCVDLPASNPPSSAEAQEPAAGGRTGTDGQGPAGQPVQTNTPTLEIYALLLISVLLVVGVASWHWLRLTRQR